MKEVCLVEFPSNLGLGEPRPGKEPGDRLLPDWLRQHGFQKGIYPSSTVRLEPPRYSSLKDPVTGILNALPIAAYALRQAAMVQKLLAEGKFPLVIGGDCSILLGAALALRRLGSYALFYLDGHTDFMDVSLSDTGGAGGMAASLVTGRGPATLTDLQHSRPYIEERNLWCVGNREYDEEYENEIHRSEAHCYSLRRLREGGITRCAQAFLEEVNQQGLEGFWLHIDVDVLHDRVMPCVDSRAPDGLTYPEFNRLLRALLGSGKAAGMEITILDPELDPSGVYTKEFVAHLTTTFRQAMP